MIQANELRQGNWVLGKPVSIPRMGLWSNGHTQLTAYGIYAIDAGISNYEPIELTPEIIEHCIGFLKLDCEYCPEYHIQLKFDFFLYIEFPPHQPEINIRFDRGDDSYLFAKIKNLHQLQNLFFSLCGEELNYKI